MRWPFSSVSVSSTPRVVVEKVGLWQDNRWLFRDLDLDIEPGSFVAVVGPSGVGKTSFLSCLSGHTKPTEGKLYYSTEKHKRITPRSLRRYLGIIFQNFNLTDNANVLTNVLCGRLSRLSCLRTFWGFPKPFKEEAYSILHDLGIAQHFDRWTADISGGEKQRVAIARALFQEPHVFLADEPISQLDTYLTGRVLGILKLQSTLQGRTVFCVLHQPELVQRFADYALSFNRERPEKWNLRKVQQAHVKSTC